MHGSTTLHYFALKVKYTFYIYSYRVFSGIGRFRMIPVWKTLWLILHGEITMFYTLLYKLSYSSNSLYTSLVLVYACLTYYVYLYQLSWLFDAIVDNCL
jgi:hypothetical protein